MSDNLPTVTVIIAARPDQAEVEAVAAARKLDYPPDRLEIIVARGKQPSVQRNAAMNAARGEWVYFLDDDALPPPQNLRIALKDLNDSKVRMVGGPNLCPPDAPEIEQIFSAVLASRFAFWTSRARYTPVGQVRQSSEKELILCNLLVHRKAALELGGFNEKLYPNEENALMDQLEKGGGRLIYDPEFFVYRRPRRTAKAFARMFMTYGRGRAEQFRVHPTLGSAINFAPPLFCLYLLGLVAVLLTQRNALLIGSSLVPLGFYFLALFVQTIASIPAHGATRAVAALPWLTVSHVLYGFGFWRGLFTRLNPDRRPPIPPVNLETVPR